MGTVEERRPVKKGGIPDLFAVDVAFAAGVHEAGDDAALGGHHQLLELGSLLGVQANTDTQFCHDNHLLPDESSGLRKCYSLRAW